MDMSTETSIPVRATQFAVPSTCGHFLASVNSTHFELRETATLELLRSIALPANNHARFLRIDWSPIASEAETCTRVLLADEDNVRIWDIEDRQWSAVVDNGSGGMGKIAHAEFGSNDAEILVFSSFGASVAVWSLTTGMKKAEIQSPKFPTVGYGRNRESKTGTFALLTRPAAQDILTLHAPGSYSTIKTITLPTADARGLKWSRGGKWLAVWDTPSLGYKVSIYTADGNLYRTYTGDYYDDSMIGLGLKSIEWSPNGDYCAIGGYENTVTLLRTTTFSPAVYLAHTHNLKQAHHTSHIPIHGETVTAATRSYTLLSRPTTLPTATPPSLSLSTSSTTTSNEPKSTKPTISTGISIMTFNTTGYLLATKNEGTPTTAWIWDLRTLQPRAIIVQHSIIKKLSWHPTNPNLLMILCQQDDHIMYLWEAATDDSPRILDLTSSNLPGRSEARWIQTAAEQKPLMLAGTSSGFVLVPPYGQEECTTELPVQDSQDENFTTDNGSKELNGESTTEVLEQTDTETAHGGLDDTFQYRRKVGVF